MVLKSLGGEAISFDMPSHAFYTARTFTEEGPQVKHILYLAGKFFYFLMGWQFEPVPPYLSDKHVIIGFPHTSNMDAVRAFLGYWITKRTGHIMVKKEWFFWPMSWVFKIIGGIPIDRRSPQGAVEQMADIFNSRDEFLLAIVPEGTRKKVTTIKKGFWHIAKAANVSIICWFLDNKNKKARWLGEIIPGDNMMDDLIRIRDIYEKAGYLFPLDVADPPGKTIPNAQ
jgi:1-acyl-sn-glycerol-3-phosphate acyltransferase